MRILTILFLFCLFTSQQLVAQTSIKILTEKKGVSLRGLAVPSEKVIWASGSKGNVALSVDGGNTFTWSQVQGYETRDFRAIHAWNEQEAIIVAVAAPAVILKTIDGGAHWDKVYENKDTSMFLDAIAFKNDKEGSVIGDPINDTIFLLNTKDKGKHWEREKANFWKSIVSEGEAFFASSNSNLVFLDKHLLFVSGGLKSRFWMDGIAMDLPIMQGAKSTGANSIAVSPDASQIVIVGGDFMKDTLTIDIARGFKKYGNKYEINTAFRMPNGYRSCVAFLSNNQLVACGTSGVDLSIDNGKRWDRITTLSFHVVKPQPNTKSAVFAGSGGRIGIATFK